MIRRVLFGGSFDPPTNAHLQMATELSKRFDEVVIIPAFISPFKLGGAELSAGDRLKLCEKVFGGIENAVVSDVEIKSEGTSYSFLTAKHFSGDNIELFFAIGSDGLDTLDKWKRADELAKAVTFYVVERPFFEIDCEILGKMRKTFRIEIAPFVGLEGSSSLLKVAVAFGKANEVVPQSVALEVEKRGLYRDYEYITNEFPRLRLNSRRVEHVYRTAKAAIILAKKNGADIEKTVRAALMHDCAKYLDEQVLNDLGISYDDKIKALPESCRHQLTGRLVAERVYGENDEEVLSAIATHTTGDENMGTIAKIIFAADYIEEGRDFDGIQEIRALTYRNLDEGIASIYENTVKYLSSQNMEIADQTLIAYRKHKNKEG